MSEGQSDGPGNDEHDLFVLVIPKDALECLIAGKCALTEMPGDDTRPLLLIGADSRAAVQDVIDGAAIQFGARSVSVSTPCRSADDDGSVGRSSEDDIVPEAIRRRGRINLN